MVVVAGIRRWFIHSVRTRCRRRHHFVDSEIDRKRDDDKQNARVYSLEIVAVNGQNGEKYCFVTAYITDFTANGKKAPKPDFGFLNMTIPYILTATVRAPNVRVQ